ncbi:RAD54L2 [Acanthosepion pharaonis]|uniref:RAD54L2 n=1 Tax=Acanthosepion pharaonis TaxID=158019 RepID=A0A812ET78_ACAPH|nr:RAD54L2 [Sepia pharaonis]
MKRSENRVKSIESLWIFVYKELLSWKPAWMAHLCAIPLHRKKKKDKDSESGDDKLKDSAKKRKLALKRQRKKEKEKKRRNIRSILRDDQLEAETLAAQNEEMERQRRLQELKKQMQQKVVVKPEEKDSQLKSLLQGDCPSDAFYLGSDQIAAEDTAKQYAKDDVILLDSGDENKKKVLTDIIELSDDDDVVMIKSDEEPEEEEEEEEEEDMDNVGTHINDSMNQKDEQGRVLINIGHPEGDPDVFLASQIAEVIKPHQIGGVRFLYDNVIESQSRFKTSSGFGCILAHSMGLGKTIQLIGFIDIFLRFTEARSVLCIVPINTLQNWLAEFNMWLPEKPPEDTEDDDDDENMMFRNFRLFVINDNHKTTLARAKILDEWSRVGGVLLMGYEMYRLLVTKKCTFAPSRRRKKNTEPIVIDIEEEDMNKKLHLGIQKALVNPGPDLIVCDEGHRIKNSLSGVAQSLKNIRTKRRVVLTGYPLQNNLLEYWCMVDFVRPNYLGTKAEFCNMFERPIMNGQCVDSTREDVTLMRYRAHVLHSLLQGFIQRRGHSVLQYSLPPKQEHVFNIRMSDVQRKLYKKFMECISDCEMGMWASYNPLKAFSTCCKIWNHPDVMWRVIQQQKSLAEDNDLDFEPDGKVNGVQQSGGKRKSKSGTGRSSQSHQACNKRSQSHTESNNSSSRNSNVNCCSSNVNNCGGPNNSSCSSGVTMNSCGNSGTGSGSNSCGSPGMNSCSSPNMNSCAGPCNNANLNTGMGNASVNTCAQQTTSTVSTGTNSCSQGVQANVQTDKRSDVLSLDWVSEVMKEYTPGLLENGGKMVLLFSLIEESLKIGDKLLVFSQSLTTLNVIEDFLSKTAVPRPDMKEKWCKNRNYFRLDGSTSAAEREKLINQFNDPDNSRVWLFLLSTRAGCLGINLIGANRVVIFDASWNPCHDCQAVCRVYRYGQEKKSYIYRLITDNSLEKKIYDRQINKQGMSDRVVDELNPENQFTRQQVDSLLHYVDQDLPEVNIKDLEDYTDPVMKNVLSSHGKWLTKEPFTHESLLLDQKSLRLTKKEKQLAKQGYVMEKKMNLSYNRQSYSVYYPKPGQATYYTTNAPWPNNFQPGERPVASVKPIISTPVPMPLPHVNFPLNQMLRSTMPGQQVKVVRPGVSVHQIVTTTDIMLPGSNNNSSYPDVIPAGQQIHVIKTPRGVYIRTNKGKIFAVRSKPVNSTVGTNTGNGSSSSTSTNTTSSATIITVTTASSNTTTTTPSSNASGTTQLTFLDNRTSSQVTSNSNNNASNNTTTTNTNNISATTTMTSSSNSTSGSTNSAYPEYLNYLRSLKPSFQPNYQLLGNNIGGTGNSGNNFSNQLLSPHMMQSTPTQSSFLPSSSSSSSSSRQLGSQPLPAHPPHPPKPISIQKDNDIYIISDDEGKVDSEPDIVGSNNSSGLSAAGSNCNRLSSLLPQTSSSLELSALIGDTSLQSSSAPSSGGSAVQSSFSCNSLSNISPSPLSQVLQSSNSATGNPASCTPNTELPNRSTFSSVPQAPPLHHHQQQLQPSLSASITNSGLSTPPSNLNLSPSNFSSSLSSLPPPPPPPPQQQQQQQQQSLYNMPNFNYGYMLPQTMMMSNNGTSSTGNSGYHPLANTSSVMNQPLMKNNHLGKNPSGTNLPSSNNTDPNLTSLQQVHPSSSLLSPPDHHPHPLHQQLNEPNDLAKQPPNIGLGPSPILTLPSLSMSPDLTHPTSNQI